jgi:hypothetical protein
MKKKENFIFNNRRSVYTRYVDPTAGHQTQAESDRKVMPPPPPPPVLQTNQTQNTESSNNKLEESGGAKHIDAKLIEMITSEVTWILLHETLKS